jgi:hypothetical protein
VYRSRKWKSRQGPQAVETNRQTSVKFTWKKILFSRWNTLTFMLKPSLHCDSRAEVMTTQHKEHLSLLRMPFCNTAVCGPTTYPVDIAIAQAVSHWLTTTAAPVRSHVRATETSDGQSWVSQNISVSATSHSPTAPHSLII